MPYFYVVSCNLILKYFVGNKKAAYKKVEMRKLREEGILGDTDNCSQSKA